VLPKDDKYSKVMHYCVIPVQEQEYNAD